MYSTSLIFKLKLITNQNNTHCLCFLTLAVLDLKSFTVHNNLYYCLLHYTYFMLNFINIFAMVTKLSINIINDDHFL